MFVHVCIHLLHQCRDALVIPSSDQHLTQTFSKCQGAGKCIFKQLSQSQWEPLVLCRGSHCTDQLQCGPLSGVLALDYF